MWAEVLMKCEQNCGCGIRKLNKEVCWRWKILVAPSTIKCNFAIFSQYEHSKIFHFNKLYFANFKEDFKKFINDKSVFAV